MSGYYDIVGFDGIRTPAFVQAEMRTVDVAIKSLGADIQRFSERLPAGFMDEWLAFRIEWEAFRNDNSGWLDRAWNPTFDKVEEFRQRAASWRDQFVRAGGSPSAPELPKSSKISWPAIVVGAGIVSLAAWYLFKVDHS